MSEQEQFTAIGRMAKERAEARQKIALLRRQLEDHSKTLHVLAAALTASSLLEYSKISGIISAFQSQGGLEGLAATVEDFRSLRVRESELTSSLKDAGIE